MYHCLWGFCVGLCFGMYYILSLLVLQSSWRERESAGFPAFNVFWMSCYCICPVDLPHSAMGCSAVCDCGIS